MHLYPSYPCIEWENTAVALAPGQTESPRPCNLIQIFLQLLVMARNSPRFHQYEPNSQTGWRRGWCDLRRRSVSSFIHGSSLIQRKLSYSIMFQYCYGDRDSRGVDRVGITNHGPADVAGIYRTTTESQPDQSWKSGVFPGGDSILTPQLGYSYLNLFSHTQLSSFHCYPRL